MGLALTNPVSTSMKNDVQNKKTAGKGHAHDFHAYGKAKTSSFWAANARRIWMLVTAMTIQAMKMTVAEMELNQAKTTPPAPLQLMYVHMVDSSPVTARATNGRPFLSTRPSTAGNRRIRAIAVMTRDETTLPLPRWPPARGG